MRNQRHALLDTDFISKMYIIQKDEEHPLIKRILNIPGYIFYCHGQVRTELARYNNKAAAKWLDKKISGSSIVCYNDEMILTELKTYYGSSACAMYTQMLKIACETFAAQYFQEHYSILISVDYASLSCHTYMEMLHSADRKIVEHHDLGEIKSYILLQLLQFLFGEQVYIFCSDDKNARNGAFYLGNVRCISVLSAFLRLKRETGFTREDAEPYIRAYKKLCEKHGQKTFRICEASKEGRMLKVPCQQVMEEIFSNKFVELGSGALKYL